MKTYDQDPTEGWQNTISFFKDFTQTKGWEFLAPMVSLAEWVATLPDASRLYPGTSLYCLTVALSPGYNPELPVLGVEFHAGQFEFRLRQAVGQRFDSRFCTIEQVKETFIEFVEKLKAL